MSDLGRLRRSAVATAAVVSGLLATAGQPAVAASRPAPRAYANCTALRAVYPHGVARVGAYDVVRGNSKPVTSFAIDSKAYNLNVKSDRDGDSVACEKH